MEVIEPEPAEEEGEEVSQEEAKEGEGDKEQEDEVKEEGEEEEYTIFTPKMKAFSGTTAAGLRIRAEPSFLVSPSLAPPPTCPW